MAATTFDAVVVAGSSSAAARVLGLTLVERGRRVAAKLGARRVLTLDGPAAAGALAAWDAGRGKAGLLVLRAADQVVHMPLAEPLLDGATALRRVAVTPEGDYAGALYAEGPGAAEVVAALAAAPADGDRALAARWLAPGSPDLAEPRVHGDIARHAATTAAERRGAQRMLLGLLLKSEDGPVTKYVYRPVSRPLTRLLVGTPITPNQVSILVLVIGMAGCWFTAQRGQTNLIIGTSLVLAAGFIDGCDGEIARLRLLSSKLGAWLDTVVDELTTTVFFVAIGWHVHLHRPADWVIPSIVVGVVCYVALIYGIYYFLIVVSKTGNSQHYVGKLEVVDDPAHGVGLRPRPVGPPTLPPWLRSAGTALAQVIRRDFINLGSVAIAFANGYLFIYLSMLAGGVVTAVIILPEHIRLRRQLRDLRRRGAEPRLLPALTSAT